MIKELDVALDDLRSMYQVFQFLFIIAIISTTIYGLSHSRRIAEPLRWILFQLLLTSACELYGYYSIWTLKKIAFPMFHFLNPIEYILYALFFFELAQKPDSKKIILATIGILTIFSIGNTLWLQPLTEDNSNAYLAGAVLMIVYSLLYYLELYQREDFSVPIVKMPDFWIVTGIFFLYAGSFFVMGFIRIISVIEPETAPKLYIINLFLNILLYALVFYGFRCATRVKT